jgi:PDZ domain
LHDEPSGSFEGCTANRTFASNIARSRNLKHMVEVLRDATGEFIEFTFDGNETDTVVFKRKEVLDSTEEVLSDNGIRQQYSADIAPIWNQKK